MRCLARGGARRAAPPERRDLASRAWPAVERANPGLPGAVCELAADLAEAAGAPAEAAERLVESARRALAGGAYATAEATAERARRLAPSRRARRARRRPRRSCEILEAAGKPAAAWPRPPARRASCASATAADVADLLLVLARAALAAGDADEAGRLVDAARADLDDDASLAARVEAIAAYVALDQGRVADAADSARRARRRPRPPPRSQPSPVRRSRCSDGWLTSPSRERAMRWFQQAADLAAAHGLAGWELRARHELALAGMGPRRHTTASRRSATWPRAPARSSPRR